MEWSGLIETPALPVLRPAARLVLSIEPTPPFCRPFRLSHTPLRRCPGPMDLAHERAFPCKQREKRRGWDSNPRDDLTPPTRFPIALLRPTRTPLRGDGQESTKKRTSCYRSSPSGLRDLWSSRCSSPFHRTQYEERDLTLRLPLVVIVGRIHLYHLLPEAGFILRIC